MRLGQTSAIQFTSKLLVSVLGFLATLYFAREVGSGVLGTYFLLFSSMVWISIVVDGGVGQAVAKRMSEGDHSTEYFQLGGLVTLGFLAMIVAALLAVSGYVTEYIGHPEATYFLIALVGSSAFITLINSGLVGNRLVHLSGLLNAAQSVLRVALQVGAVAIGFGITGLVYGWVLATLAVSVVGVIYLGRKLEGFPARGVENVRSRIGGLYDFAKYSWANNVKGKTNNYADILILGLFVPNNLIGVYAVSWNIASFLSVFGASVQETLFPEISRLTADDNEGEINELVTKSVHYAGMFVIPGLIGGAILGERILRLYGEDFVVGTEVLFVLIVAVLLFDYQKQFTSTISGMDRPDLAFRINVAFIGANIVLNVLLIYYLGWVGAAVATALSSGIGLLYSYWVIVGLLDIELPYGEIRNQVVSGVGMGGIVLGADYAIREFSAFNHNFAIVLFLVGIGATTYTFFLVSMSAQTRRTILRNLELS